MNCARSKHIYFKVACRLVDNVEHKFLGRKQPERTKLGKYLCRMVYAMRQKVTLSFE
jgi:hypothetical protein